MLSEVLQIGVYKAKASGGCRPQILTLHLQVDLALVLIKSRSSSSVIR